MKITEQQLCKALSEHDGEEITNLAQVQRTTFSGQELLEFINSLLHAEKPKEPKTHAMKAFYRNGIQINLIGKGAAGVVKTSWFDKNPSPLRDYIGHHDLVLHDSETGECWRDSGFDIMDFENVKKFITT